MDDGARYRWLCDEFVPKDISEFGKWCQEAAIHIHEKTLRPEPLSGYFEGLAYCVLAASHAARMGNVELSRKIKPPDLIPIFHRPDAAMALLGECVRWAKKWERRKEANAPQFTRDHHGYSDLDLEKLRLAIARLGKSASAEAIRKAARIAKSANLAGLHYLTSRREYSGFVEVEAVS